MPDIMDEAAAGEAVILQEYTILKQRVDLDVDFAHRSLRGSTEITIQPLLKELKQIKLHSRQCRPVAIQAGGITARFEYDDPYRRIQKHGKGSTVHQHGMLKDKIRHSLRPSPMPELVVTLPPKLKIQELHLESAVGAANGIKQNGDDANAPDTPTIVALQQQGPQFAPIKLFIEFEVQHFYDGLHWVGFEYGDKRFPYCYTKAELFPGITSCLFPCVDDANTKCSWDIAIRCAKTLGDAFRNPHSRAALENGSAQTDTEMANGDTIKPVPKTEAKQEQPTYLIDLGEDDAELDLTIVCVGEQVDDVADAEDETRHTVSFALAEPVTARHVGFAIGPFEHVELSASREAEEEERLGQNAVKVDAFCLPDRSEEVRITCLPITKAIDHFGVNYGSFPFSSYQMLFVDDFTHDTVPLAGVSLCSARLLFPYEILEPLEENTRKLIRALSEQWMGVHVIAQEPADIWAVSGIAGFMTDLYGKVLFGNNAYRWQQKLASEKVYDLDVDRPSIQQHGHLLHIDPSIREFLDLKSALILFILDRRLLKANGSSGVTRIINRIFLNAKTGTLVNGELSTADFQKTCEKLGHNKLEAFFKQWVVGAGCPIFHITQKFNKKKLVVEMVIIQKQRQRVTKPPFEPSIFMREVIEHVQEVWAPEVPAVFTGPMTIRIHEADGTPYEHIVEIKEATTRLEIPYNTKYKRLKRSRRQKERAIADGAQGEGGEDALLYCLGDILDTPEDVKDWNLADWTPEDEEKMGQESYEWIRVDADFEWIGKIHLVLPLYMYISQLQQDRDLAAQYESMRYVLGSNAHHVSLTILLRTLMDRRYFHGIRAMAAEGLAILAKEPQRTLDIGQFHLEKAFQTLFCFEGEIMPKPNDWSDRTNYIIQCAIPKAMVLLRDDQGKVPLAVRKFFVDKLKFNDNSNNEYSDCHYIATLMHCLTDALVVSHRAPEPTYTFSFGDDEPMIEAEDPEAEFEKEAIDEIERYRRIDEWVTTYQNIYSTTALACLSKLSKAGLVKDKTKEVLQYTRSTNADLVRLEAFKCLNETGITRRMPVMKYMLQSVAEDFSPFLRNRLTKLFGEALGHIALGDREVEKPKDESAMEIDSGLILEQEESSEARQLEATRKTTPEGALKALKAALYDDQTYRWSLWYTATSKLLTLDEVAFFCDTAALMFEPISSYIATAKLPRPYKCDKVAKATVRFVPHGAYRTVPRKALAVDDWDSLQQHQLKYTGAISAEAKKAQKVADEQPIKLQLAHMRQSQTADQQQMPPPSTAGSTAPTPTTEKSGFKLTLGAKRKQSTDATPRAGSPKAAKTARQKTPTAQNASRRPSISSRSSHGKSLVVKLPVSISASSKIREILSRPSKNAKEQSRSITPASPFLPGGLGQSPTSNNYFASSSQSSFNLGGFRSFGPPAESPTANEALFRPAQPEIKRESIEVSSPLSVISNDAIPPLPSASPPAVNGASGMPPPPKPQKKITLKLGSKLGSATSSTASSPK